MTERKAEITELDGTPLSVQWIRPCTSNAGDLGLTPGQGTRSHMLPQLSSQATTKRSSMLKPKMEDLTCCR